MRSRSLLIAALVAVGVVAALALRSRFDRSPRTPVDAGATVVGDVAYGNHPRQRLDVFVPAAGDGPHPAVIWIHPGGWFSGDKSDDMPVWDWTDRGFVVVAINYRFAVDGATIRDSVADALAATTLVLDKAEQWSIDANRVGVYGFSAGGHLAAMVAADNPRVAAVVTAGAPTDFRLLIDPATAIFEERSPADAAAEIRSRLGCVGDCEHEVDSLSPALQAPGEAPVLIVHGEDDTIVHSSQAQSLAAAWRLAGAAVQLIIAPGRGHSADHPGLEIEEFFREHLSAG